MLTEIWFIWRVKWIWMNGWTCFPTILISPSIRSVRNNTNFSEAAHTVYYYLQKKMRTENTLAFWIQLGNSLTYKKA